VLGVTVGNEELNERTVFVGRDETRHPALRGFFCSYLMPARVQPQTGLRVTFYRCGLERDSEVAPTPERALRAAILMLAKLDDLIDGVASRRTRVATPRVRFLCQAALSHHSGGRECESAGGAESQGASAYDSAGGAKGARGAEGQGAREYDGGGGA